MQFFLDDDAAGAPESGLHITEGIRRVITSARKPEPRYRTDYNAMES